MAYRALYRQYRPTRFEEVIGQEHVTRTLKNQVASGKLAHAYLFCGIRGTGKTTSARILSRAANCLSPVNGEPCGQCEACRISASESNGDIVEIDAASNNSVDNVRDLIEKANFMPLQLHYRVYIIDEVHMLSTPAFNALLKTLEEPPDHVLFILATTESQKVPATIRSRCQRFDFHRLTVKDIVATCQSVLKRAGASIDEKGLQLIARSSDGGMRDALSLCDQCLSFCGDHVTAQDVYDVLGSMESEFLFSIADSLLESRAADVLEQLGKIVRDGHDLSVFTRDLAAHFRALLLVKNCGRCEELVDCSPETMDAYIKQAEKTSVDMLLLCMQELLRAQSEMRFIPSPRTLLESTLVRICRPEDRRDLDSLLARMDRMEENLKRDPLVRQPVQAAGEMPAPTVPEKDGVSDCAAADDSVQPDLPPWEEEFPAEQEEPEDDAENEPEIPASSIKEQPKAEDDNSEDVLWNKVIGRITNPMVRSLASSAATPRKIEGETLVVSVLERQKTAYNVLNSPVNLACLNQAIGEIRPGMQIRLVLGGCEAGAASQRDVEQAKKLFGDKLIIE